MHQSFLRQSILLRMVAALLLGLVMLIAIALLHSLILERQVRREEAVSEIGRKWGSAQTIAGPVLTIPVRSPVPGRDGATTYRIDSLHCLPQELTVGARLTPEVRYRGIYRVVLYRAVLDLEALLDWGAIGDIAGPERQILWNEAYLTLGLSDLKGIKEISEIRWNEETLKPEPGLRNKDIVTSGFTLLPRLQPGQGTARLQMSAEINGSEELRVVPLGETTSLRISGDWSAPSFVGDFLPAARRIQGNEFEADWRVLHLNRNYPQWWLNQEHNPSSSAFGVRMLLTVDEYQKNSRAVKYAILFIILIFIAFFVTEILTRTAFHPMQYALVGAALMLFYLLLLSLSEHTSFNLSFLFASAGVVAMVALYIRAISARRSVAGALTVLLSLQYLFLFVLLQLEDWALSLGSLGLFAILATIMYLTRKIDWFDLRTPANSTSSEHD